MVVCKVCILYNSGRFAATTACTRLLAPEFQKIKPYVLCSACIERILGASCSIFGRAGPMLRPCWAYVPCWTTLSRSLATEPILRPFQKREKDLILKRKCLSKLKCNNSYCNCFWIMRANKKRLAALTLGADHITMIFPLHPRRPSCVFFLRTLPPQEPEIKEGKHVRISNAADIKVRGSMNYRKYRLKISLAVGSLHRILSRQQTLGTVFSHRVRRHVVACLLAVKLRPSTLHGEAPSLHMTSWLSCWTPPIFLRYLLYGNPWVHNGSYSIDQYSILSHIYIYIYSIALCYLY